MPLLGVGLVSSVSHACATVSLIPARDQERSAMAAFASKVPRRLADPKYHADKPFVGKLSQKDIDHTSNAWLSTSPEMISDLTDGKVKLETHVVLSNRTLKNTHRDPPGMIYPEDMSEGVGKLVDPKDTGPHHYQERRNNLPDWPAYYRDMLSGVVDGHLGYGSKAWAFRVARRGSEECCSQVPALECGRCGEQPTSPETSGLNYIVWA
ncbi:uncharacterized protein J7T54_007502 [Emericellopsis cladophorae]|uniref:Uncharacterized protein n=1 Tax=Emericellopsis cladophorae TaxID=2686198 RepID=A0A9P9XY37_9HYPO|nr:uncharacterized protein J7T54_007502 [Emericellopsis cladophorae]KAI6780026.1 hypothetical protein J7T54_007502 [Emericellopsis cladophorae]